jgi:hypothetical protein
MKWAARFLILIALVGYSGGTLTIGPRWTLISRPGKPQ